MGTRRSEYIGMFHCELECPISAHGRAADSARRARSVDVVCRFDHWDEFGDDHVLPLLTAITGVRVKAVCGRWKGDDELADLSLGNHLIELQVCLSERAPAHFVLESAVKEIQHGIFFCRKILVRRRKVEAIPNFASKHFALK